MLYASPPVNNSHLWTFLIVAMVIGGYGALDTFVLKPRGVHLFAWLKSVVRPHLSHLSRKTPHTPPRTFPQVSNPWGGLHAQGEEAGEVTDPWTNATGAASASDLREYGASEQGWGLTVPDGSTPDTAVPINPPAPRRYVPTSKKTPRERPGEGAKTDGGGPREAGERLRRGSGEVRERLPEDRETWLSARMGWSTDNLARGYVLKFDASESKAKADINTFLKGH